MKKIYCFILFYIVKYIFANLDHLDVEVEYQCIQHCPLQNRTDVGHYDYACDYDCNIDQCTKGCKLWRKALNSTCQKACNGQTDRLTPKELYCVMGCNDAMTKYFSQLRARLLTPPPPALVADSLNATSLKLEWNFPEAKKDGLSWHIQWRYEELTAAWQYCRNVTWEQQDTIALIENLQPYTKYRFRVALITSHHGDPIVSSSSVVISTLPSGVPASAPVIVRAAAIDCTRISVSWEPGPFPHGPLLSYVLQITDNLHIHSEVKDIPPENTFYMFRNLKPSRNYTMSIRMTNGVGSGPAAKIAVSTPSEPLIKDTQQPVLILGTQQGIIEQGTDILDEPIILYSTIKTIKGIAIHISQKLLFISDSGGNIIRLPLSKNNNQNITTILSPNQINFLPLELSVDWLHNQLYILGEVKIQQQKMWQIARCDLHGKGITVAIAGLRIKPHNIEVDPYNGYLFWVIQGYSKGGLYRLDLSDISNGIKHGNQPEQIIQDPNLGAFIVDHSNFRLLVSNQKHNTINTVSLDGKEITNLRPNVIKSKLQKVISLATANKKFYWTDGDDVFYEEYHNSDDSYFHNSYPALSARSYKKVIINLQSSQPIPIPVNPPTNVQAIFGSNIAKVTWQAPHLLGIQGKGAWQNWSYEISIKDIITKKISYHKYINNTSTIIKKLKENTEYILKAVAYTSFGKGPWSSEFTGITLNDERNPIILWSANKGLLKSDATGENVETLIHKSQIKDFHFTDITWFKNQIYLVNNNSQLYWYNLETHTQGRLMDIDSVGSVAIDWIGMKLYWSNPKQQLIIRGNFNGTQQEPLPILTLAKELNIDSVKAYLYWSTGYAVECAHLNGANRREYHHAQLFSGKQVMGLTLDMERKNVYWIVRGSEGSNLFRAPMAGYLNEKSIVVEQVSTLQKSNMQGPLCYFHKRLLWLQDDKNAAISDLEGKNVATISGKSMSGLTLVYVVDSSLHLLPNISYIQVIPEMIDKSSVRVIGSSNSFNVSWKSVNNVNYGTVFYQVKIDSLSRNDSTIITQYPSIKYWQQVTPFTKLHVAIRAFTYWGSSSQIRVKVFSPPSTPSAPRNLRSYVTSQHHLNESIVITFRWDPPTFPNGVLQGYKVHYCIDDNNKYCEINRKHSNELEFILNGEEDKMYHFQVQAFTEIGDGDLSNKLFVNSSQESPLPTLCIATQDSIFIQDTDSNQNLSLVQSIITPIEIVYLIKENKIFWINQMGELFMYNLLSGKKTKIVDGIKDASSLTIDWLERSIYYVEIIQSRSFIIKIDLNMYGKGNLNRLEIFSRDIPIDKIEISPFKRKLYWIEEGKLMASNTDGTNIEHFFKEYGDSCESKFTVGKYFTIDHSTDNKNPLLIITDPWFNVVSRDSENNLCKLDIKNDTLINYLPIEKIQSDFGNFYWTNYLGLNIFKRKESIILTKNLKISDMKIFGPHMQPYPDRDCLIPQQNENLTVKLTSKSSNSLTIQMPNLVKNPHCPIISLATVEYKVYLIQQTEDGYIKNCSNSNNQITTTHEKILTINNLKPFTKYLVCLSICNFYIENEDILIGKPVILQTAPGAPSKPQKVSATVLNPNLVKVSWFPPKEFNGETVHYEIYWQTEGTVSGVRQKEQPILEKQNSSEYLTTLLSTLSPNVTYTIWVRAYSEANETSSDSERVQVNTYPEPNNLILVNRTAYNLKLSWKSCCHINKYQSEYSIITSNIWDTVEINGDNDNDDKIIFIDNLKPKTQYKFRILLYYENYPNVFVWPPDSRFIFETLGDRPSPPGIPIIQYIKPNIYKVWWEASKDNGASVLIYMLEGLKLPNFRQKRSTNRTAFYYSAPSVEEGEREWQTFYNGSDTSWIIEGLSEKYKYAFRVSALNSFGWSNPSEESTEFDLNEAARMAEKQNPTNLIFIATFTPFSIFLLSIFFFCCRKFTKPKKIPVVAIPRGPDVELATLRELPRRGVHNTNVLYVSTTQPPTTEEITLLPHIRRDQITLMKFLGSGAFGEVFEGKAKLCNNETKVAVKTLRKGASDQEKSEFLQEAQLMSNFKHEHILQLLGVCLDNDPHFIIMELMQGGDLLTYLRSSRNPSVDVPALNLIELLKMCVDVAKGCRYLEEMHFVHRDLACRNCLVNSTDTSNRVVKIGDFGLARDIYKNDYYRKEGEGLLPVRWMAPESLVDGVFTSQSDVWAFGVLLWEIMTLGQQPYPARNNLEVLHYVRRGGRLGKPLDCPEILHNLMLKCWEFEADKRPTFKYCLEILDNLHFQNLRNPKTGAHEGQYISTIHEHFEGISNEAYFRGELYNSGASSIEDEDSKEKIPFLANENNNIQQETIPKYLELLYVPETTNDGYEIPNQILHIDNGKNQSSSILSINSDCSNKNKNYDNYEQKKVVKNKFLLNSDSILKPNTGNLSA